MKVNPIIIVDDTLCYSLVKAQKVYEKNRKKKDKKEIRVAIYTHKGDVKPCHTFLVKTTTDFTNLYLQICHIIYLEDYQNLLSVRHVPYQTVLDGMPYKQYQSG